MYSNRSTATTVMPMNSMPYLVSGAVAQRVGVAWGDDGRAKGLDAFARPGRCGILHCGADRLALRYILVRGADQRTDAIAGLGLFRSAFSHPTAAGTVLPSAIFRPVGLVDRGRTILARYHQEAAAPRRLYQRARRGGCNPQVRRRDHKLFVLTIGASDIMLRARRAGCWSSSKQKETLRFRAPLDGAGNFDQK